MRISCSWILMVAVMNAAAANAAAAEMCDGRPKIERAQLDLMFDQMRAGTEWDVSGALLWGYFFTDAQKKPLAALKDRLVKDGYRYVALRRNLDWMLHVERVEAHSPESLDARNAQLYELAEEFGVDCYDGMDVGPIPEG